MVLVVANAFEFERNTVEEEARFSIEADRAKAAVSGNLVDGFAVALDDGLHFVECGLVERPKLRRFDRNGCFGRCLFQRIDGGSRALAGELFAVGIEERGFDFDFDSPPDDGLSEDDDFSELFSDDFSLEPLDDSDDFFLSFSAAFLYESLR